jgi:hypothetical protein
MRLGQLARKLSIRQSEIVDFLLQQNIQIEDGSNTRLEDTHVVLIMKQYAPAREEEVIAELASEKQTEEPIKAMKEEEKPMPALPESNEEKPEVIRVPKIELSGLKVVGKIELPEPKKKEEKPADIEIPKEPTPEPKQEERPHKTDRKAIQHKKERKQRPHVNPLALQREREAREAAEKRRIQAEREKEKRKQHYHNKVKTVRPGKPAKPKVESVVTPSEPQPTTWWGKFLKWLRP